jgi:hypothetical protein
VGRHYVSMTTIHLHDVVSAGEHLEETVILRRSIPLQNRIGHSEKFRLAIIFSSFYFIKSAFFFIQSPFPYQKMLPPPPPSLRKMSTIHSFNHSFYLSYLHCAIIFFHFAIFLFSAFLSPPFDPYFAYF